MTKQNDGKLRRSTFRDGCKSSRKLNQPLSLALPLVIALASLSTPAFAADDGKSSQIENGRDIAEAHCAPCHAIEKDDASPTRTNENTAFRDLYKRFPIEMLVKAAKTGSIDGHDEMPAFDFSMDEINALLAYIDSLAPAGTGKYRP